jgi:hypothetical protein
LKVKYILFGIILSFKMVLAGDPCPIDIDIYEAKLSWRDNSADISKLKSKYLWLGISYKETENSTIVLTPHEDSPAMLAGIKSGDNLLAINKNKLQFYSEAEVSNILDKALNASNTSPITFEILRQDKIKTISIKPAYKDPLLMGIYKNPSEENCLNLNIVDITPKQKKTIEEVVVDKNKGFRCKDAHLDKKLIMAFESGSLIMTRGEKRVIFVMPHWQTVCVESDKYDGASSEELKKLLNLVTDKYTTDRFRNP